MGRRLVILCAAACVAGQSAAEPVPAELVAAYRPLPQDYPAGGARPDTSASFRRHFFRDGAVARFDSARMTVIAHSFNPLEGEGVDKSADVKWALAAEHAVAGKAALRVEFPAAAIRAGKAVVNIRPLAGPPPQPYLDAYRKSPAAAYAPHYRRVVFDAFNPSAGEVRIRVRGVPMILPPGACTVAVRTVDAAGTTRPGWGTALFDPLSIEVAAPAADTTLFLDNVRMEQEVPELLAGKGRGFQFPARADAASLPVLWPGFTPIEPDTTYTPQRGFGWTKPAAGRRAAGHSFRSLENGLVWGRCAGIDSPLRIDVPPGRWGIWTFANPARNFPWARGAAAKVNGVGHALFARPDHPWTDRRLDDMRRAAADHIIALRRASAADR